MNPFEADTLAELQAKVESQGEKIEAMNRMIGAHTVALQGILKVSAEFATEILARLPSNPAESASTQAALDKARSENSPKELWNKIISGQFDTPGTDASKGGE